MKATTALLALVLMPVLMAAPGNDSGEDLSGPQGYLLLPVLLGAVGLHYVKRPFVRRFSKMGWWESTHSAPDGTVNWLGFQEPASVIRIDALVRFGRYRVENGKLYVGYLNAEGGLSAEEIVSDAGVASSLQELLHDTRTRHHPIYPPITIGLEGSGRGVRTLQGFRPDGTCQIVTSNRSQLGKFEKTASGIRVRWTYPPQDSGREEAWVSRRTGRSLFITDIGGTIEYRRKKL